MHNTLAHRPTLKVTNDKSIVFIYVRRLSHGDVSMLANPSMHNTLSHTVPHLEDVMAYQDAAGAEDFVNVAPPSLLV